MGNAIDFDWLKNKAKDEESKQWIARIAEWRKVILETNEFIRGDNIFSLHLGSHQLWFKQCGAFSSVEVYQEIFKENNHFLIPGFSGRDANLVIDIGANEGFYALKIKESNPHCKVICVEPNPYIFAILKKNIECNHVKDVKTVNKAVASTNGEIDLEIIKEIGAIGGKSLKLGDRQWMRDEFIQKVRVETITLERLFCEYNLSEIDILKIDVEGMEMEILYCSRHLLQNVRRAVIERHSKKLRNEIIGLLKKHHLELIFDEDPECKRYYGDLYFANTQLINSYIPKEDSKRRYN